jgi:hypothetical protein
MGGISQLCPTGLGNNPSYFVFDEVNN